MVRSTILVLLSAIAFVVAPRNANASSIQCSSQIVTLVASNTSTDSAHLLYINNGCTGICTGSRAYIEFADKTIFAQALAAKTNATIVTIQVENAATSK